MNRRGADRTGPLGGAGMVGLWGASSLIKSIQRGTIVMVAASNSNTATIAAVDTANAVLVWLGTYTESGGAADTNVCRLSLTNSTTITANADANSTNNRNISYSVIEYAPGVIKSIQRGTKAVTATTDTATITTVNTAKSEVMALGWTTATASTPPASGMATWALTDATTLTFSCITASRTVGWQVVEYF